MTTNANQQENSVFRSVRFWYALASGPVLWALHLVVMYGLASDACQKGYLINSEWLSINALSFVLIVFTLVILAGIAVGAFLAYQYWRNLRRDDQSGMGVPEGKLSRFLSFSAMVLSILFGAAVLITLLPIFVFDPCS